MLLWAASITCCGLRQWMDLARVGSGHQCESHAYSSATLSRARFFCDVVASRLQNDGLHRTLSPQPQCFTATSPKRSQFWLHSSALLRSCPRCCYDHCRLLHSDLVLLAPLPSQHPPSSTVTHQCPLRFIPTPHSVRSSHSSAIAPTAHRCSQPIVLMSTTTQENEYTTTWQSGVWRACVSERGVCLLCLSVTCALVGL